MSLLEEHSMGGNKFSLDSGYILSSYYLGLLPKSCGKRQSSTKLVVSQVVHDLVHNSDTSDWSHNN